MLLFTTLPPFLKEERLGMPQTYWGLPWLPSGSKSRRRGSREHPTCPEGSLLEGLEAPAQRPEERGGLKDVSGRPSLVIP